MYPVENWYIHWNFAEHKTMPILLNVGAGSRLKEGPAHYTGWEHVRLDIDTNCGADIVCDARLLRERFPPASYDAIYCSHNLGHYYPHDGARVLALRQDPTDAQRRLLGIGS